MEGGRLFHRYVLASVLAAEGVELGRARAHDVVRGRDVLRAIPIARVETSRG